MQGLYLHSFFFFFACECSVLLALTLFVKKTVFSSRSYIFKTYWSTVNANKPKRSKFQRERNLPFLSGQKFHLFFTTLWVGVIIKLFVQGHIVQFLLVQRKCKTYQRPPICQNQWKYFSICHLGSILAMSTIIFLKSLPLTPVTWNLSFFHTGPFFSVVLFHLLSCGYSPEIQHSSPQCISWVMAFLYSGGPQNGNDSPKYLLQI